jgi:hypothetical protein
VKTTLSRFATAVLSLKGKPFSFEGYEPFQLVYDTHTPEIVLKAGRQVGKSVSVAGRVTVESIMRRYFNSLYVTPLSKQASRFSTMYLDPYLNGKLVKKHFRNAESKKNVYEKSLTTGSIIFLGYGETEQDADRIRGISSDSVLLDEIQDIDYGAVPVIFETLSASPFAYKRASGTSKTLNNTLEHFWNKSNQSEWGVKCSHCSKWSLPSDLDACLRMTLSKSGPSCIHCGSIIDVSKGEWIRGRPSVLESAGYHLPQIIFASRTGPKKWGELYSKVHSGTYSPAKIANEVFGLAYDFASKPISMRDCLNCCNPDWREFEKGFPSDTRSMITCVMGIDWSVTASEVSFTVITIFGVDYNGKMFLLHSERLQGVDILEQVAIAAHLYRHYNVSAIGTDRGMGVLQGQMLVREFGQEHVFMLQYVSGKERLRWDQIGGYYAINRTQAIDNFVYTLKQGRSRFETPCWEKTENFWVDAMSIYDEETLSGMRVYRKDPNHPDDWLHSCVFAQAALEILMSTDHGGDQSFDTGPGNTVINERLEDIIDWD